MTSMPRTSIVACVVCAVSCAPHTVPPPAEHANAAVAPQPTAEVPVPKAEGVYEVEGYTVERIYEAPAGHRLETVQLNNAGEIVWTEWTEESSQVFSNRRGQISSGTRNWGVDINDSGQVVWQQAPSSACTPKCWTILLDGEPVSKLGSYTARINNLGEVVWDSTNGIWSHRRGALVPEPSAGPEISNEGEVVYRRSGAVPTIHSTVRGELGRGDHAAVNDLGEAVWMRDADVVSSTRELLAPGRFPDINNHGDVLFSRRNEQCGSLILLNADLEETVLSPNRCLLILPGFALNDNREAAFITLEGERYSLLLARPTVR